VASRRTLHAFGLEDGADSVVDASLDHVLRAAARTDAILSSELVCPLGPGVLLGSGRFVLQRRLGRGGMGVVYRAMDHVRQCQVALKILRQLTPEAVFRLKREYRGLQGIEHPNLVRPGEILEEEGRWFFTMELVEGADFSSYVRSFEPAGQGEARDGEQPRVCDEQRLREAFAQLIDVLAALHGSGTIHRDVKPSNVLVTHRGRVVLLDLGLIADRWQAEQPRESNIVGTAAYMAPEQATAVPVGPEADWYAAGVLLYKTLTGELPFSGAPLSMIAAKRGAPPAPPSARAAGVPGDLEELCMRLLEPDPRCRPGEAEIRRRLGGRCRRAAQPPDPVGLAGVPGEGDGEVTFDGVVGETVEHEQDGRLGFSHPGRT
jgi:eukaryotic-like serine/threonine-protein kinase